MLEMGAWTPQKTFLMKMELSLLKHGDASFDGSVTGVNRELSTAIVKCAALR